LVFESASRSIENSLLASSSRLAASGGGGCPKLTVAINHTTARPMDKYRLLLTGIYASEESIGKNPGFR
jgi:hypothetical protein